MKTQATVKCTKCEAPLFFNRVIDSFGNSVVSLNCWNGHYEWIEFEDIIGEIELQAESKEKKDDLIVYMGLFNG